MVSDRKWPLFTFVSLGIGISTIFLAGRSLARAAFRWQFSKKSNAIQTKLKEKFENPLSASTVVTCISDWEEVYSVLSRFMFTSFFCFLF